MAIKTLFGTNTLLGETPKWQELSETSPGANATSSPNVGWIVGNNTPTKYKEMDAGVERSNASWGTTAIPDTTLGNGGGTNNGFRTAWPLKGFFADSEWIFNFVVRAVTAGNDQDGAATFRVWKGPNANGSGATLLTPELLTASTVTNLTAATDQTSSVAWKPGALEFDNEYLFVEVAWKITGAGGGTTRDVIFRWGDTGTRVVTPDFQTTVGIPEIASVGANASGTGTDATLNAPSGVTAGDLLIAVLSSEASTNNFSAPEGWTKKERANESGAGTVEVWEKIATGSDSYIFTQSSANAWLGFAFRVTGHDPTVPVPVVARSYSDTGVTSLKTGTITTPRARCRVISIFAEDGDATGVGWSSSGAVEFFDAQEGVGFVEIAGYSEPKLIAGEVSRTAQLAATNECESIILAIQPPAAGGYAAQVLADEPSAYFRHNESSGTAAEDEMGGTPGVYGGGVTLGVTGLSGDSNKAVDFNGTTGRMTAADRSAFDLGDNFTIEALIKFDTGARRNTIVAKGTNAYVFRVHEDNFLLFGKDGVTPVAWSNVELSPGQAYHVAVTKNGATVKIYVDGVETTDPDTAATFEDNNQPLSAWAYANGTEYFFDGIGDELALYKKALSAERIKAHYDALAVPIYNDSGSGTITASGLGTEDHSATDSRSGVVEVGGSRTESLASADLGLGVITLNGSGAEAIEYQDSGSGTTAISGSGAETQIHEDSRAGTIVAGGSSTESAMYQDSEPGAVSVGGTSTESGEYLDGFDGPLTWSGVGNESFIGTDTGSGFVVWGGSGEELAVFSGSGEGNITFHGTGEEKFGKIRHYLADPPSELHLAPNTSTLVLASTATSLALDSLDTAQELVTQTFLLVLKERTSSLPLDVIDTALAPDSHTSSLELDNS